MTNETVEKAKADTKKAVADIGNKMAHAKADVNADVEKIKANFGKSDVEKSLDFYELWNNYRQSIYLCIYSWRNI